MNIESFAAILKTQPEQVKQTPSHGGSGPGVSQYYETERYAKFKEFASVISSLIDFTPSKEDVAKEKESLKSRLMDARQDKLLAAIAGSGGNQTASVVATKAAEQESLLSYMYDMLNDSPKQYLAYKKAEMLSKIAPSAQGLAALVASGGLNKAEALQAAAQMAMAGAQARGAELNYMAAMMGRESGGDPNPMDFFLEYINKGGPKGKMYNQLEKAATDFIKTGNK